MGKEHGWNLPWVFMSMEYNELKLRLLTILAEREGTDSASLSRELAQSGLGIEIHAVRMAVMRYYKLGLLKRRRVGGMFIYSLTDRGLHRLRWLQEQKHRSATVD